MRRLLFLFLSLFTLVRPVSSPYRSSQRRSENYTLANGCKFELDFFGPKDALQYFDKSVLTDGFAQLSNTYKLTDNFHGLPCSPRTLGGARLSSLLSTPLISGLGKSLHPTTNAAGLRGLPLFPRPS